MIEEYEEKWLIKAANDLHSAKCLIGLPDDEMTTDTICFHCQQAVEKYLKTFLIFKKINFARSHNIGYLLELCKGEDKDFEELQDSDELSVYAVEARYPDNFIIPSKAEAQKSFEKAMKVKQFVLKKLGKKP